MTTFLLRDGNGHRSCRRIHGSGEAVHAALLPVLQVLLMPGFEVGVLHHDNGGSG